MSCLLFLEIVYVQKEGQVYGDGSLVQNGSFNDAKDLELSYNDRCIAVELQWSNSTLLSIRFTYSNNRSSIVSIAQQEEQSVLSSRFSDTFNLNSNEEISQISLYQKPDQMNFNIIGIRFSTTSGRTSGVFGSNDGHLQSESFENCTFAYARGNQQTGKGIEMLQFFWLKRASMNEQIEAGIIFYVLYCLLV